MDNKNIILKMGGLFLLLTLLANTLLADTNSTKETSIQVYGAGEKLDDKSYGGAGVKYQTPELETTIEYGNDYKKASAIYKYDINTNIYIKGGLGFLTRELALTNGDKDADQLSGGVALGYGDNINYNIEVGHIISKLRGINSATDGNSGISYLEVLGKKDFGAFGTADITGVYKNTHVYSQNHADYSLEAGYYPTQLTNDFKISTKYESIEHDKNNYVAKLGIEYIFSTDKWKPFMSVAKNVSKRTGFALVYSDNIANKKLSMRDEFENDIATSDIVAQKVAPKLFENKINPVKEEAETTASSNPTISMNNQTAHQPSLVAYLPAPTVTNVDANAVYSIVGNPDSSHIRINSSTGVIGIESAITSPSDYDITIKVVNPDDGASATTTFHLHIN